LRYEVEHWKHDLFLYDNCECIDEQAISSKSYDELFFGSSSIQDGAYKIPGYVHQVLPFGRAIPRSPVRPLIFEGKGLS
jgi:hypothetical protein